MNITYNTQAEIQNYLYAALTDTQGYALTHEEADILAQYIIKSGKSLTFYTPLDIRLNTSLIPWRDWLEENGFIVAEVMEDNDLNREEAIEYMKENFSICRSGDLIGGYVVEWQ